MQSVKFESLKGKTLVDIKVNIEMIQFKTDKGEEYEMFHDQDCCESVSIEEIIGDIKDLLNVPILLAEEVIQRAGPEVTAESATWTFYKLSTIKGSVTIRWYGESNGYYSESVDFRRVK